MSMIDTLLETRDAAEKEYEDFVAPLYAANRALSEDEETRKAELKSNLDRANERVVEVQRDVDRADLVSEARQRLGTATADVQVSNIKEARIYGPGSLHSYFADHCRASSPAFPGHDEAIARLNQHAREVAGEMRDPNSAEGQRALRAVGSLKHVRETANTSEARESIDRAMHFGEQGLETRAGMSTSVTSGGSFVTPQYFVSEYAPYRLFNRVFADQARKFPLPSYGMTIYVPAVNTSAGVAAQIGENQGITETDPNAGYLSVGLTTNAGQVTVSQQLLDRAGPDFNFDVMIFDQLQRSYNATLDSYCLTQAIANAGTVAASTASLQGTGGIFANIAKAKAAMVDAGGVVLPATHVFFQPVNWEWMTVQSDSQGRSLVNPDYAGAWAAIAGGADGAPVAEGFTGYKINQLPVYEDGNIPLSSTNNQAIVAHMPEVWFWEGDLVTRTVPQTVAQNLSVLLQVYAYVGEIVRYQKAVQCLQGAAFPTAPTF